MKRIFTLLLILIGIQAFAQNCPIGYSEIIVQIVADQYPNETSWDIINNGVIIASGTTNNDTVCVPNNSCVQVQIHDSYGDGIYLPGGYWIYLNGTELAHGDAFGSEAEHAVACPQGSTCSQPFPITTGSLTTLFEETCYT